MPSSKRRSFEVGDRIVHKKNPFSTATGITSNKKARHGVVVDIVYKINARGAKHPYIVVRFDDSSRTETYMASRIEHESDKEAMLNDIVESVN